MTENDNTKDQGPEDSAEDTQDESESRDDEGTIDPEEDEDSVEAVELSEKEKEKAAILAKRVWVRALRDGEYPSGFRRRAGDVFMLNKAEDMSKPGKRNDNGATQPTSWMENVEAPE